MGGGAVTCCEAVKLIYTASGIMLDYLRLI